MSKTLPCDSHFDNSNCRSIIPLLDAFYDGELEERQVVLDHVRFCGSCQKRLDEIELVVLKLQSLPRLNTSRDWSGNFDLSLIKKDKPRLKVGLLLAGLAATITMLVVVGRFVIDKQNSSTVVLSDISKNQLKLSNLNRRALHDTGNRSVENYAITGQANDNEIATLFGNDQSSSEELGITTDEDGLYALKL